MLHANSDVIHTPGVSCRDGWLAGSTGGDNHGGCLALHASISNGLVA